MDIKRGIPVSPGIAIGEVFLLEAEGVRIPEHFISQSRVESEIERLEKAMAQALAELEELAAKVTAKAGSTIAEIFNAHAGMLRDKYFRDEFVERIVNKRYTAEFAVSRTMRQWRKVFQEDAFLATRVPDLDDLERRLLRNLLGAKREELGTLKSEVVLVAHDLSPSQTATVDTARVKAIAIDAGGPTGHTAIIASALGIPAVVGCTSLSGMVSGGDTVIVDGVRGVVIIDPDEETLASYRMQRTEAMRVEKTLLHEFRDQPAQTLDGRRVRIYANIEFPREVTRAVQHGAEGIGLYRTEFLYLTSERSPTEEEHFEAYMEAIRQLDGRPIIIRTVDLGADKFAGTHDVDIERNPFLGRRSIRYCLEHPDVLQAQLRAILRASVHGNVHVMFPLVSSLEELVWLKACLEELRQDFERRGQAYDRDMEVGIMIEVPSAAVVASMLAPHVDFFSIGTNDLIQYTIAIDRANEHVAHMYRPLHPAVLRLIKMTADAAHDAGIEVGLCGEMASEVIYGILLLGLGIDHLSVAPAVVVPELKKIIRSVRSEDARKIAERILACSEADAAMATLMQFNRELCPDLFPSPPGGAAARP
jgi:phosphotransferase system enzyme I (PtsI)